MELGQKDSLRWDLVAIETLARDESNEWAGEMDRQYRHWTAGSCVGDTTKTLGQSEGIGKRRWVDQEALVGLVTEGGAEGGGSAVPLIKSERLVSSESTRVERELTAWA